MRRLVAVITLACFGGCAATATIARRDGPDTEARIEHSDAGAVYVRARNGGIYRIPGEQISFIDHPGNVEILVGGIVASMIAALSIAIVASGDPYDRNSLLELSLVYGGSGLALMTWGLLKYIPSLRAARAFESPEPAPQGTWIPVPPPAVAPPLPPQAPPPAPPPTTPAEPAPALSPPEEPKVIPDATSQP